MKARSDSDFKYGADANLEWRSSFWAAAIVRAQRSRALEASPPMHIARAQNSVAEPTYRELPGDFVGGSGARRRKCHMMI
ncbi:hypothetical protein MSC49_21360 [Methylosinus sp. C49]|nr:hypothetical protein MSC49_21360 [Methylosinus sp. C49]